MFPFLNFLRKSVSTASLIPSYSRMMPRFNVWDGKKAIQDGFKSSVWVYACVNIRMRAVASVPWVVQTMSGGEWVDAPKHPLKRLIDFPNPDMDRAELMRLMMSQLDLCGNAYWTKVRAGISKNGAVVALWPVPKPYCMKIASANGITRGKYEYRDGDVRIDFTPTEIVQFSYTNPDDMFFGISPLQAMARAVDIDTTAAKWQYISLMNRGIPDGIFSVDNDANMSLEEFDNLRRVVREQYANGDNARAPWVVKGASWQQMSMNAAEMDFINSRKFTREEICSAYSVPPPMVGSYENATLANIETARQIFWRDTIIPLLDELESHLNLSLAREFGTPDQIRIVYDTANVQALQENYSAKIDNATKLFSIGVPLNEINRRLELGLSEDIVGGDTGYIAAGLIPAGFDFDSVGDEEMTPEKAMAIGYGVKG